MRPQLFRAKQIGAFGFHFMTSQRKIIERHRASLRGLLRLRVLHSKALGIRKPYYVYEPPNLQNLKSVPVLFLFRGHEREWVNVEEDGSRTRTTIEDLDVLFSRGELPPMLVVMPGLNSSNNHVPSLGINMVGDEVWRAPGLGTGRFWDFLDNELIPAVEANYPQTDSGLRLAAGFSLGGYTVSLIAAKRPGYLTHAGIYDGLFMWPEHIDQRQPNPAPFCDPIWTKSAIFDAAFGKPRHKPALRIWNPTDVMTKNLPTADPLIRQTTFWVSAAPADGVAGNRDRAKFFLSMLREKKFQVGKMPAILHRDAAHTWHWADSFLVQFLRTAFSAAADGQLGKRI